MVSRLLHATPQERNNWRLIGKGEGIHWPDLDETSASKTLSWARFKLPAKPAIVQNDGWREGKEYEIGHLLEKVTHLPTSFALTRWRPIRPDKTSGNCYKRNQPVLLALESTLALNFAASITYLPCSPSQFVSIPSSAVKEKFSLRPSTSSSVTFHRDGESGGVAAEWLMLIPTPTDCSLGQSMCG